MLEELKLAAFGTGQNAATLSHPCMVSPALLRNSQKVAKDTKERTLLRVPRYGGQAGGAHRAPMLERLTQSQLFRLESGGLRRQQWLSLCVLRDLL
jgi:hypothetical protein